MKTIHILILFTTYALLAGTKLLAAEETRRMVQYVYDGGGAKTQITITAFGGPAIVTVSTASHTGKTKTRAQLSAEAFERLWAGFSTVGDLVEAENTNRSAAVDSDTHHLFYTLTKTSEGSTIRSYGVLANTASNDFREWLRLIQPEEKSG